MTSIATFRIADLPIRIYRDIRADLLSRREVALIDVREEDHHARSHPLFAANLPLSRIETDAFALLPRRNVPIVLFDASGAEDGLAVRAAVLLRSLGYANLALFEGGVAGWARAGGELFRDVNVPSKAFAELVEAVRHTPSLSAEQILARIESGANMMILDARPFHEYQSMSIPGGINVPGGELALRMADLVPDPATLVVINCAGRTRSIIGAQSLINAKVPHRVVALRNGTIGWTLAGFPLETGQSRTFGPLNQIRSSRAAAAARQVSERAGVGRVTLTEVDDWRIATQRSSYFFDVRTQLEYETGHLPGFRWAPGGQLVQETEMFAPVRGARMVLVDDDGVRANMTASWLAQMNWDVYVLDQVPQTCFSETGPWLPPRPPVPARHSVTPDILAARLATGEELLLLDFATAAEHRRGHLPGARFLLRSRLDSDLPSARTLVLTSPDGALAGYVATEVETLASCPVLTLTGGTAAWAAANLPLELGLTNPASPPLDHYRRPYEGLDNPQEAMATYLEWEYGLVEQLKRDGTHGFRVI